VISFVGLRAVDSIAWPHRARIKLKMRFTNGCSSPPKLAIMAKIRLHLVVTRPGGEMMQQRRVRGLSGKPYLDQWRQFDHEHRMSLITALQARLMLPVVLSTNR
jgi:hypothetical protein